MKTHIIHLEPYDDLASTKDKMGWGQSGRILLVWPPRGRLFTHRLDLVQLQRYSVALGAELALVTRQPEVQLHAERLGLPVFRSLRKAQQADWESAPGGERPEKRAPDETRLNQLRERLEGTTPPLRLTTPASRLSFFSLGVAAFLTIAALLLPSAEIRLVPETQTQELTLTVVGDPSLQAVNLSGGLPARPIRVVVEGRESIETGGRVDIPHEPAGGEALFTNLTDQEVAIPEGTVVRTLDETPLRFITTRSSTLPAQPGATLSLPVLAQNPGEEGNLPPGSLAAIDGPLGLSLAVTNPEATVGGSDRSAPAPSPSDYDRLRARLLESLAQNALEEVASILNPDDYLVRPSLNVTRLPEEAFDPPDIQPSDTLTLSLQVEYEALVVSGEALRRLAEGVLDANLPESFVPRQGSLQITHLTEPEMDDGAAAWEVHIQRVIQTDFVASEAISLSIGLPPEQARQRLSSSLPLASPPEIRLLPSWWPRLPILPFRISVVSG